MRALPFCLTAGAAGLLAGSGFAAAGWFDAFDACRVAYRVSGDVRGSLACQTYYAIVQFSTLLAFAACGLMALAGILFLVRPRTRS